MKSKITCSKMAFLPLAFLAFPFVSLAQNGSLDLTFGINGIAINTVGSNHSQAYALAIQSDGKIVVAGYSRISFQDDFALARYNTNGSLDNTFGTNGVVTTPIGNADYATDVAIQSDGKIVVAGNSYHNGTDWDFALTRYNSNGSLDNTFGANGIVTTGVGDLNDEAYAIDIQGDGKIVVAGQSHNGTNKDFALTRYNTNGSLDNTFGTNGIVTTPIGVSYDIVNAMAIQSDGKIVVAGFSYNGINDDFALTRYLSNGSLDSGFGINGILTTAVGISDSQANSLSLQSDGKIVVAGFSQNGNNSDFALLRYTSSGSIDNSFGTNGIVTTDIGTGDDYASSSAIQGDGKIVVAGFSHNGIDFDFSLALYHTNGMLDSTFGTNGIVQTPIGATEDFGRGMALQSDGKIVMAGSANISFAVARYDYAGLVGLDDVNNGSKVGFYPNPFSTQTVLHTNENFTDATLTVFNSFGETVKQIKNMSGQTITLHRDNLTNGLYFIQLTQDDKIIFSNKLIITN